MSSPRNSVFVRKRRPALRTIDGQRHPLLGAVVWAEFFLIVIPLSSLVVWAFLSRWNGLIPDAWTLRGVTTLLAGTYDLWAVSASSIVLSLFVAVCSVVIALCTARAVVHYGKRWRWLVDVAVFFPIIVPATVFGMGSHVLFISLGLGSSLLAVIIVQLLCSVPWAIKMMVEVTETVGNRLEQQARVLGARPLTAFLHGTLPSLAPGVISSLGLAFIMSNSQYFLTLLLGGGRVQTLATLVFPLVNSAERCVSSAYGLYFILINAAVFLLFQLISNTLTKRFGKNLAT